jgi:hypothetical protein
MALHGRDMQNKFSLEVLNGGQFADADFQELFCVV